MSGFPFFISPEKGKSQSLITSDDMRRLSDSSLPETFSSDPAPVKLALPLTSPVKGTLPPPRSLITSAKSPALISKFILEESVVLVPLSTRRLSPEVMSTKSSFLPFL